MQSISSPAEDIFMPRIVIFANGEIPDLASARALLQPGDYLIAADGGANHLLKMGILPEIVIGHPESCVFK